MRLRIDQIRKTNSDHCEDKETTIRKSKNEGIISRIYNSFLGLVYVEVFF